MTFSRKTCDFFCFKTMKSKSILFSWFSHVCYDWTCFLCSDYSGEALHPHEVHPSEGPERILWQNQVQKFKNLTQFASAFARKSTRWCRLPQNALLVNKPVFRIRHIFVRIRVLVSVHFIYGSGSRSCVFSQLFPRWQQKIVFLLICFAYCLSLNSRNQVFIHFFACWWNGRIRIRAKRNGSSRTLHFALHICTHIQKLLL